MFLKFREFAGHRFDFLLAQSVFTHLMPESIEECFADVGSVMHSTSAFYFTYNHANTERRFGSKNFAYPFTFFQAFADRYGVELEDRSSDYPHPREQRMVKLSLGVREDITRR